MSTSPTTFHPLAGLASLILPGAGHVVLGQTRRGLLAAVGVLGLFFGGLFIGGIDVVDSKEDKLWFIGQALVGPVAFGVDYAHQHHFKGVEIPSEILSARRISARQLQAFIARPRSAYPNETREVVTFQVADPPTGQPATISIPVLRPITEEEKSRGVEPPNRKSLSKVNELGTLFATIAGMLNLIVIMDAAMPSARRLAGTGASGSGPSGLRQEGLKTTLADAESPLGTPSTISDPLRGGTPGAATSSGGVTP